MAANSFVIFSRSFKLLLQHKGLWETLGVIISVLAAATLVAYAQCLCAAGRNAGSLTSIILRPVPTITACDEFTRTSGLMVKLYNLYKLELSLSEHQIHMELRALAGAERQSCCQQFREEDPVKDGIIEHGFTRAASDTPVPRRHLSSGSALLVTPTYEHHVTRRYKQRKAG